MVAAPDALQIGKPASAISGLVEIASQLGEREIFVSGWARGTLAQGMPVSAVSADGPVEGRLWLARFDRPDVGAGAGFSGVVELVSDLPASALRGLSFGERGRLALYEGRSIVALPNAIALLQIAIGSMAGADIPEILQREAARYAGSDTVSGTSLPIRLGIDDCAALGGHGLLVSGWIFDPERLVRQVRLESSSGSRTISDDWVRQARADVTASVLSEPRFAGYAQPHACHGFVVLADIAAERADLHLTLEIVGAIPLHYPIAERLGRPVALIKRFLRSISPDEPSSLDIVDRLVVPVLESVVPERPMLARVRDRDFPEAAPLAIVIGCSGDCEDVAALFSILATDGRTRRVSIVVAADAAELDAHGGDIERAAALYGLPLRLASGDGVEDAFDALNVGVEAARAPLICMMTMAVSPRTPDWLTPMEEMLRQSSVPCAVLPCVSDIGGLRPSSVPVEPSPYRDLSARLDCCLIKRSTFQGIGGFSAAFLTPSGKARDFVRRLALSGTRLVHAAASEMVTSGRDKKLVLARRADRRVMELRSIAPRLRIAG